MPSTHTHTATLLLGSNLGNREDFLQQAEQLIAEKCGPVTASSSVYETKAWGKTDQSDYLNKVVCCETTQTPVELLMRCLSIEKELGRTRAEKWGNRTIDIDLLYMDRIVMATNQLILPHPQIQHRKFVLIPLNEIDPEGVHPVLNFSNKQLLERCTDTLLVELKIPNSKKQIPNSR